MREALNKSMGWIVACWLIAGFFGVITPIAFGGAMLTVLLWVALYKHLEK